MKTNCITGMKLPPTVPLRLCFVLAAGLVMSACVNKKPVHNQADFTGSYTLVSVDGKPVPANISHDGAAIQVRSGTFTINADGTCSSKTVFVPPSGSEVTRDVSATFTRDGSKLAMRWKGAGKTVGTIQGNTFTMDNEGTAFVYRK
jgi:hypothetical protein